MWKTTSGKLLVTRWRPSTKFQNCKDGMAEFGCEMFGIPARSPDLNPIENIFHIVRRQLKDDALEQEINNESYKEFCNRIEHTFETLSTELINKTISSMPQRIQDIMKNKGHRTKY